METNTTPISAVNIETATLSGASISSNNLILLYQNEVHYKNNILKEKVYLDTVTNTVKLFKDDIELTVGINNAIRAYLYDSEYWSYKDLDGFVHLYKNSIELTKNIKTLGILRHPQISKWLYANEKNKLEIIPIN
jgi:hypothetical protein